MMQLHNIPFVLSPAGPYMKIRIPYMKNVFSFRGIGALDFRYSICYTIINQNIKRNETIAIKKRGDLYDGTADQRILPRAGRGADGIL